MTIVLPIHGARTFSSPASHSSEPTTSFAALLDNTEAHISPDQAHGFAARGMFGRHGAVAEAALKDQRSVAENRIVAQSNPSALHNEARFAFAAAIPGAKTTQAPQASEQDTASQARVTIELASESPAPNESFIISTEQSAGAMESEIASSAEDGAAAAQFAPPLPESRNGFNLSVAGPNHALVIAARGADEISSARLRQMMEDTAAEFGMDVAEFKLNGAETKRTPMIGGNHGNSAR